MSFIKDVEKQLEGRFKSLGFRKKGVILFKPLGHDASAFLGLPRQAFSNGVVSVSAIIGTRFEPLYELGKELGAYPESKTNPALSISLKYLAPSDNESDYRFLPDRDNHSEAERLVTDVQRYGLPLYEAFSTMDKAMEAIRLNAIPEIGGKSQFIPLYHLLRGNTAESLRCARESLASMDAGRGSGKQYARFVDALNERCGSATP